MNDDSLNPPPVNTDPSNKAPGGDVHESAADRIFDFSDGDIKRVIDTDGPVTVSVNKQIEAALRNPIGIRKSDVQSAPATATAQPPKPRFDPGPVEDIPQVKIYSQISHEKAAAPIPTVPVATAGTHTSMPPHASITPVPPPIPHRGMSQPASTPKPGPRVNPSLQEILARVHTTPAGRPAMSEGDLLDKKIGTFEATPFVNNSQSSATPQQSVPATPPSPIPIPPKIVSAPVTPRRINMLEDLPPPSTEERPVQQAQPLQGGAPIPPAGPIYSKPPAPQPAPVSETASQSFLKPLRTYEGDVAEAMSHRRTSVASIAIAETKKETGSESISTTTEKKSTSHVGIKIVMVIVSIILIASGAVGGYYLYSKSALAPMVQSQPIQVETGIIRSDSSTSLSIDGRSPSSILSLIKTEAAKDQKPGSIKEIILTEKRSGTAIQVTTPQAVETLGIDMPDILLRSLTAQWMLGIYADTAGDRSAFVIGTTNFFQNAFAGMLQWEYIMADDLKQYVYPSTPGGIANAVTPTTAPEATSTASSSTPQITQTNPSVSGSEYTSIRGVFKDLIVRNKDVRAFRTESGTTLFVYSFVDNSHLIVAKDENVLAALLERLEKQSFIR